MNILVTPLFQKQLKSILEEFLEYDIKGTKDFKLYLDTILINLPTKLKKYKKSIYFDDETIKDIEFKEFTIVFKIDNNDFIILGIFKKIT